MYINLFKIILKIYFLFIYNFWPSCQGPQAMVVQGSSDLFASLTPSNKLSCHRQIAQLTQRRKSVDKFPS